MFYYRHIPHQRDRVDQRLPLDQGALCRYNQGGSPVPDDFRVCALAAQDVTYINGQFKIIPRIHRTDFTPFSHSLHQLGGSKLSPQPEVQGYVLL